MTHGPIRLWRRDPLDGARWHGPVVSGRRAVVVLVGAVLVLGLVLGLAFQGWKVRYQARAAFGAARLAPAVDPMVGLGPPGIDAGDWRSAVEQTHAMLLALAGSGVLDEGGMETLRREIAGRVERARPATARRELAAIWDDLEHRAGPVIAPDRSTPPAGSRQAARHPRPARPALLGPATR